MTDKPEIKVGQRWVTWDGRTVRILATDCGGEHPVCGFLEQTREADFYTHSGDSESTTNPDYRDFDLRSLAPSTVKREVALYRDCDGCLSVIEWDESYRDGTISEPLTIEFTLLEGETP